MTRRHVLVINPNTNERTTRRLVDGVGRGLASDEWEVVGMTAANGPAMIVDPAALEASSSEVIEIVQRHAGSPELAAIVVGAIGDPGLAQARAIAGVPVIGLGEASMREAAEHGDAAIVTSTPLLAPALEALFSQAVPAGRLTGVFLTESAPERLASDAERQSTELADAAQRAVAQGARAVVVGGGPLSDAAAHIRRIVAGIPVIAPTEAAGRAVAEALGVGARV